MLPFCKSANWHLGKTQRKQKKGFVTSIEALIMQL